MNIAYKNYNENAHSDDDKATLLKAIKESYYEKYPEIARDIIKGKYGNGQDRKNKLKALNIDYEYAQAIVNVLVM